MKLTYKNNKIDNKFMTFYDEEKSKEIEVIAKKHTDILIEKLKELGYDENKFTLSITI